MLDSLKVTVEAEQEKMEKDTKQIKKYKEIYGQLNFTEIPNTTSTLAAGEALTQINLDKTKMLR